MADLRERFAGVLDYVQMALPADPVFGWILDEMARRGLPAYQISEEQGRFLALLVRLSGARAVLEIGALGGYSTVWLARALPADGRLTTLEREPAHAALANEACRRAGVADRVTLRLGPALESLAALDGQTAFDLVFIDADKGNNRAYLDWARGHVRAGGLIVVDNVLASGQVADLGGVTPYGRLMREFDAYAFAGCPECCTVVPFYRPERDELDGMLVYRQPAAPFETMH